MAVALAVASSMLGTTGLVSYRLYRQNHLTDRIRVQALTESYVTQITATMLAGGKAELPGLVTRLAWHPDSRLLAVLDATGRLVTIRGSAELLQRYQEAGIGSEPTCRICASTDGKSLEYAISAAPIQKPDGGGMLGTVVYAMVPAGLDGLGMADGVSFFVGLMLIAATGMLLGFFWLKRSVLDPLSSLVHAGDNTKPASPDDELPLERDDEIGDLARALAGMHVDVEEWRNRAARLERSIDDRVAHATERITRELKSVEKKSWTDPLTRLNNRRLLEEKLEDIFVAQRNAGKELCLVMMDLDHFKRLNDTLGHRAGDSLLEFTGELLRQCLRDQDIAVRYGGDEFVLVLPSVTPEQAQAIAERTIAMFNQRSKLLPIKTRPSMSAGIASLQRHRPQSAEDFLQMADAALYQAKFAGKGRAVIYSSTTARPQRAKVTS
jgi:diguanylate cyclase (GGDEF)-like protein